MQNEKLKKFTDFFLKYRRYFCAAVLFVILVVILVKCTGPQKDQKETQNGTQGVTQTTEYQEIGKLQKDADAELVTLMENYYAAYAGGDTDSLEMIAQPLSDNEKSYITTFSEYYEDYQNITCYSTKGATDDSYLVSVCYDLKFKGVDTPAPGMDFFYVERDGKGNLIINNIYSAYNFNFLDQDLDANLYSLILAYEKSDEVVALQKEVQTSYNEAVKSDEKLANMVGGTLRNAMAKWRNDCKQYRNPDDRDGKPNAGNPDHRDKETGRNSKERRYAKDRGNPDNGVYGKEGRYPKERFQEIYRYGQDKRYL